MHVDDVKELIANDLVSMIGRGDITVEEAGPYLEEYYQDHRRWNRPAASGGFWGYVEELADVLRNSNDWPFPDISVCDGALFDGHHRVTAAIIVDWQGDIPVDRW